MTPEGLVRTVEDFLAGAQEAMVLDDDGSVLFDLAQAKYSVSGERNKCLLHLWSAERNLVRRVLEVEIKNCGAGTACASRDRYAAALPVTGDRMDGSGPR